MHLYMYSHVVLQCTCTMYMYSEGYIWCIYILRYRLWLDAVATVMLTSPWKTQKAGALCLTKAVERSPQLALYLLNSLDATQKKVRSLIENDVIMLSYNIHIYMYIGGVFSSAVSKCTVELGHTHSP